MTGLAPHFHEDWLWPDSETALCQFALTVADVPGHIIEIGSWEGRSTIVLSHAVNPRPVHAVDTWSGSPGEESADLAGERDVFAQFQTNIDAWSAGNVVIHRMGWREYLPTVEGKVALAFIDAEHSYREVFDNIAALLPMMARGGLICGDDAAHAPVRAALFDSFPVDEIFCQAALWCWRVR